MVREGIATAWLTGRVVREAARGRMESAETSRRQLVSFFILSNHSDFY